MLKVRRYRVEDKVVISTRVNSAVADAVARFAERDHMSIADYVRAGLLRKANAIASSRREFYQEELRTITLLHKALEDSSDPEQDAALLRKREKKAEELCSEIDRMYEDIDLMSKELCATMYMT